MLTHTGSLPPAALEIEMVVPRYEPSHIIVPKYSTWEQRSHFRIKAVSVASEHLIDISHQKSASEVLQVFFWARSFSRVRRW